MAHEFRTPGSSKDSAATDKMDDLERVPILDSDLAQNRARDDLEIALDGDLARFEPELAQHFRDAQSAG